MNTAVKTEFALIIGGICALFAGFLNGFLGTGGGVILLILMSRFYGKDKKKEAFSSVVLAVLPMSLISAFIYSSSSPDIFIRSSPFLLPACAGGLFGALLLNKLNTSVLSRIFGAVLLVSGVLTAVLN